MNAKPVVIALDLEAVPEADIVKEKQNKQTIFVIVIVLDGDILGALRNAFPPAKYLQK